MADRPRSVNRQLSARRVNDQIVNAVNHGLRHVAVAFANIWQDGYPVGMEPGTKQEEMQDLMQQMPMLQQAAGDMNQPPAVRYQAQDALLRAAQLAKEGDGA